MKVNKRVLRSDNIMRTFFAASVVSFATSIVALGWLISSSPRLETADAADASIPAQASKVSVNVYDLISLSLNDEINVEITPEDVAYSRLKTSPVTSVSVSTNVPNGYILYIADLDSDTNLVNTDSASHTIAALSNIVNNSAKTWSVDGDTIDFTNNSWGYSTDYVAATNTGTFHGVEYARTMLKYTEGPTSLDDEDATTNLTIGARVDTQKAAGTYVDTIVLSAVPNSTQTKNWSSVTDMQSMTQEICASAPAASSSFTATKSLIDTRDGNTYMVSRLKDGNCWMTQNLALSFKDKKALNPLTNKGEVALTSENTDLGYTAYIENPENIKTWEPVSDTSTAQGSHLVSSSEDRSYSNGTWYYGDNTTSNGAGSDKYANLAACMAKHTSEECQHYKVGNFYNWTAATAGSGVSVTAGGNNATDSICPKGWQLPLGSGAKSWTSITSYYVGSSLRTDNAEKAPVYLVRGGVFDSSSGNLLYQGGMYYWSATASSGTNAYRLGADSSDYWRPQDSYSRAFGFSVRCVLR